MAKASGGRSPEQRGEVFASSQRSARLWKEATSKTPHVRPLDEIGFPREDPLHIILDGSTDLVRLVHLVAPKCIRDLRVSFTKEPSIGMEVLLNEAAFEPESGFILPTFIRPALKGDARYADILVAGPLATEIYTYFPGIRRYRLGEPPGWGRLLVHDMSQNGERAAESFMSSGQGATCIVASNGGSEIAYVVADPSCFRFRSRDEIGPVARFKLDQRALGSSPTRAANLGANEARTKGSQSSTPWATHTWHQAIGGIPDVDLIDLESSIFSSEVSRARAIVDSCSANTIPLSDHLSRLTGYVHPSILAELSRIDSERLEADSLHRDQLSTRLQRLVHRHHSPFAVRNRLRAVQEKPSIPPPSVSVLIPTMRVDLIPRILSMVRGQSYQEIEIVLAVHADVDATTIPIPSSEDDRFPIKVLTVPRREILGEVCNRALAVCTGDIVTKLDDDDTYGAEHVEDLVNALEMTGARLVGKAAEFIFLEDLDLMIQRHVSGRYRKSRRLAGGTLTSRRSDLLELGGFPLLERGIDQGLIRRFEERGMAVYRIHGYQYVLHRRGSGHTWNASVGKFIRRSERQWAGFNYAAASVDLPGGEN